MNKYIVLITLAVFTLCIAAQAGAASQKENSQMPEYEGKVNAPEFPEGLEWLNTGRPLTIRELRGKVVLLDFWTYCCINCMHIIPDLKRLEHKYANELVVIGVHSAKFTGERDTGNIRQAVLRYEVEHPVVNDAEMRIWQEYAVRAWPSLYLIDPAGKVIGYTSGEGVYDALDTLIAKVIAAFDEKKLMDRRPLSIKLERQRVPASMLAFPGKVLADEQSKRLFIADSNHNRIVIVSLADSSVAEVIGRGETGLTDGSFDTATFNHPQGMALDGNTLYVADTENHSIRAVDLANRTVATIAGTGQQSRVHTTFGGQGRQVALNSPWDLVMHSGMLYIAMAGPHQIWKMNPKTGGITPYAGSGIERRIDGPLADAALAQPSGITTDGHKLYFADSEVSSIRSADLDPNGAVETIVGQDLFEFGDRDGRGTEVRLQHPLGVVYHDGDLYIADTYNNKIKRVSPRNKTAETFAGTGEGTLADGERAAFDEPAGLSVAFGKLYVADTNNHAIRVVDLKTRRVETLRIKGLERLRPRGSSKSFAGQVIDLPEQAVSSSKPTITVNLELPPGFKLNPLAPSSVTITAAGQKPEIIRNPTFPLDIPIQLGEGPTQVIAEFTVYYCQAEKESLCYFKEVQVRVPVKFKSGEGGRQVRIAYKLDQ